MTNRLAQLLGLVTVSFILLACQPADETTQPTSPPPTETQADESTDVPPPTETSLPPTATITVSTSDECPPSIVSALSEIDSYCNETQRNEVCYGNTLLNALPDSLAFEKPGDIVSIADVENLSLEIDVATESWGVALMRLQAQVEGAIPGQAVTFLLFGDVSLTPDNSSSLVQAYTIETGIGDAPCQSVPDSGIIVQTPQGIGEVTFRFNEVDIALGSTAYFQAQPGNALVTNIIEGEATLKAEGVERNIVAGMQAQVPLDDEGIPAGPPSDPIPYDVEPLSTLPLANLDQPVSLFSATLVNEFNKDAQDWGIVGIADAELEHLINDDGNGFICYTPAEADTPWFYNAPEEWVQTLSDGYGTTLVYSLSQSEEGTPLDRRQALQIVADDGATIVYANVETPASNFTPYTIPLIETAGWLHADSPIRVTQSEFQAVLDSLTEIRILGNYRSGTARGCLDFVLWQDTVIDFGDAIIESTFDNDTEDWTATDDGATLIEHNDEGYICASDDDFIAAWEFIAPDSLLGEQPAWFGGQLVYELNQSATDGLQNTVPFNVSLVGGTPELTLRYQAIGNPSIDFTRYAVPLEANVGWFKIGDEPATLGDMLNVLSDLRELKIIGEFRGDDDTGCLNVVGVYHHN